jgi:hypothetical protein
MGDVTKAVVVAPGCGHVGNSGGVHRSLEEVSKLTAHPAKLAAILHFHF